MQICRMLVWCALWAVSAAASATNTTECELHPDGNRYKTEVIFKKLPTPVNIKVNWKTNKLYFNCFHGGKFVSAVFTIGEDSYSVIDELPGGCNFAIDQDRGEVYAGCQGYTAEHPYGLYKLDSNAGKFVRLIFLERQIDCMYFQDALYYKVVFDGKIYKLVHGKIENFLPDIYTYANRFVVYKNGDLAFGFSIRLYYLKAGATEYVSVSGETALVDAMTMAPDGYVYVCSSSNIFRFNTTSVSLEKVIDMERCTSISTDKDGNWIFPDPDISYETNSILRLVKCSS